MTELALSNLAAWTVQVALAAVVATAVARLIPIDAPAVRYHWWRAVLLAALLLPLIQPWQPVGLLPTSLLPIEEPAPPVDDSPLAASVSPGTPATPPRTPLQPSTAVGAVLVAGVLFRFAWLGIGLIRLRRLRTAGEPALASGAPDALQMLRDAGANVRYVPGLRQPVTFGIRRPVVLLPRRLETMAAPIQRAVLVHELWHVRRQDWRWSLAEEGVRAALWFNPGIWYLVSRVQSAREEVVDELSVLATNARRSYLEALLAFADEPVLYPASPFARRRHLFTRMLLISREAVMSPKRIVCSGAMMAGALVFTGWYGSLAFPLTAAGDASLRASIPPPGRIEAPDLGAAMRPRRFAPPPAPVKPEVQQTQAQPRDPRPDVARPASSREQELQAALRTDTSSVLNWLALARLQEERGATAEAEKTLQAGVEATQNTQVLQALAGFYNRQGEFEKTMRMLEEVAARDAADPRGHQLVAVYYWEKAQKDLRLSPDQKAHYVQAGIAATDRAIALNPEYVEALTYKNILLRMQANMEADAVRRQGLLAEADMLRNRAMEIHKTRPPAPPAAGAPAPPPPPPPPFPPFVDGVRAVRIGGNVPTPRKLQDVKPIYPAEARDSRVSGLVIIEALIDPQGSVREARVLRSIPILDQAALDAVKQWKFEPTLMDGVAVPVIMTVTVNFTLE